MIAIYRRAVAALMLAMMAFGPWAPASQGFQTSPAAEGADSKATIEELIEQLGDDEYAVRERAQQELASRGLEAVDALKAALEHPDIEIAARAKYLVRTIRVDWGREGDSPAVQQLLDGYGQLSVMERLDRISSLEALPDRAGLAALCRIARFDGVSLVTKRAALAIIGQPLDDKADLAKRSKTILEAIGDGDAPAVQWLRLEARGLSEPQAVVDEWAKAIAAEEALLSRRPQNSQGDIVVALLRRQAALLEQLSRLPEAEAALVRTLEFELDSGSALPDVMNWLIEHQRWDRLDKLVEQYVDRFEQHPDLMYRLAEAFEQHGHADKAKQTAAKALEFNPSEPLKHYQLGMLLQQRGQLAWAEAEYRRAIEIGPPATLVPFAAHTSLAELLHDQERHLAAAETLEPAIEQLKNSDELRQLVHQQLGREMSSLKSRLLYFQARHWETEKDRAKQIEHLDKAIRNDPTDADVLIALYRLPDQDAARRKKTLQQIRSAADSFRNQIEAAPDNPTPYNQFAWLVGNTEGDQAEALRYSQKSLELRPNAAGFLDTLARCYYASGKLDKALEHQEKAVKLEPSSGAMRRQLEFFKEEQAKKAAGNQK